MAIDPMTNSVAYQSPSRRPNAREKSGRASVLVSGVDIVRNRHGGHGGHGLTGETEQRRLNGEDSPIFNQSCQFLIFSVRSPFLRFSCASVLSVISVVSVS